MLRTFEDENKYRSDSDNAIPVIRYCSIMGDTHSTYHATLQATPGHLVLGRDMLLSIPR